MWDYYTGDSIKGPKREKRGEGVRRKVAGHTKLPGHWMEFLREWENKEELFRFLSAKAHRHTCQTLRKCILHQVSSVVYELLVRVRDLIHVVLDPFI